MLLTWLIVIAVTGSAVAVLLWAHWPDRMGATPVAHDDPDEFDRTIAEVGNVDRPRVPGESGIGGSGGFPSS